MYSSQHAVSACKEQIRKFRLGVESTCYAASLSMPILIALIMPMMMRMLTYPGRTESLTDAISMYAALGMLYKNENACSGIVTREVMHVEWFGTYA